MSNFKSGLIIGSVFVTATIQDKVFLQLGVINGTAVDDGIKFFEQRMDIGIVSKSPQKAAYHTKQHCGYSHEIAFTPLK
jgi:hypothetical protein